MPATHRAVGSIGPSVVRNAALRAAPRSRHHHQPARAMHQLRQPLQLGVSQGWRRRGGGDASRCASRRRPRAGLLRRDQLAVAGDAVLQWSRLGGVLYGGAGCSRTRACKPRHAPRVLPACYPAGPPGQRPPGLPLLTQSHGAARPSAPHQTPPTASTAAGGRAALGES